MYPNAPVITPTRDKYVEKICFPWAQYTWVCMCLERELDVSRCLKIPLCVFGLKGVVARPGRAGWQGVDSSPPGLLLTVCLSVSPTAHYQLHPSFNPFSSPSSIFLNSAPSKLFPIFFIDISFSFLLISSLVTLPSSHSIPSLLTASFDFLLFYVQHFFPSILFTPFCFCK